LGAISSRSPHLIVSTSEKTLGLALRFPEVTAAEHDGQNSRTIRLLVAANQRPGSPLNRRHRPPGGAGRPSERSQIRRCDLLARESTCHDSGTGITWTLRSAR